MQLFVSIAIVIVVVKENPSGSKGRYLSKESFLIIRKPELISGIFTLVRKLANLEIIHLLNYSIIA